MASHSQALIDLCQCLRGVLPARPDWLSLLGLANKTLITPALIDFVDRFDQLLPEDVCAYVREIYQRNENRNDRAAGQLAEAVAALNQRGITPVLLKGAATLATASRRQRATKLMADLDILIEPEQARIGLEVLGSIGYVVHARAPDNSEKWFADLKRPQDVGMIDLHANLPGPAYFYRPSGHPLQHCKLTSVSRGSAYVPTATYQVLMLTIHDQFQDYDYWLGAIDLRHLVELRDLINSTGGIDWELLNSFAPSKLAKNALETQLVGAAELLGADVPASMRRRIIPRLQFKRRLAQARFPMMRWPLLAAALLDYGNYREGPGAEYRRAAHKNESRWSLPGFGILRYILEKAGQDRVGKV